MIISTGLATLAEIAEAVAAAGEAGAVGARVVEVHEQLSGRSRSSNLRTIPYLRELFGCEVGLLDHTLGIAVAIASVAQGAAVIEKHVTLRRAEGGVDAAFSLEPAELADLVRSSRLAWEALGSVQIAPTEEEIPSLLLRRSLYVCSDLAAGDVLTPANSCGRSARAADWLRII